MRGRAKQGIAALVGLAAIVGVWSVATVEAESMGVQKAPATSIAVIDIGKVLDQLDEKRARLAELEQYGNSLQEQVERIVLEKDAIVADLEVLPKDTPQFLAKQDQAIRKEMELQGEQEFAKFRFNERKQRTKLELFKKIESAAGIFAQREGYDIVINDDRDMTIPESQVGQMNDQAFQAFVMSRRVIFATGTVDITDEVAQMMNNNYKAAQ
jgi:outer membrane protein